MHDTWQFAEADDRERALFAGLDAALAMPGRPAGPANRLRHVVRIDHDGRTWFLKTFTRTQWQNRLRFRWTHPRADDDAERELLVTAALRRASFAAPRPVARGRRGASAYYLCAALTGVSCSDLAADGRADATLQRAVADHCGRLLGAGFHLPDLAPDHVFAERSHDGWHLAVLDLHNGTLAAPGPAPARVAARVLRRFGRAARIMPLRPRQALAFALRLLRTAGIHGNAARAVLLRVPPFAPAARYEVDGKSTAYAERNPRRAARELDLLARVWPGRPGETVLDLPCGAGRLLPLLEQRFAHRVVHADGALAMLAQARARTARAVPAVQGDAMAMPFAAGAVDGVVMFRFLHHLPADARRRAIAEACRTARRFVVASFFHPCSAHHLQRCLRRLSGRAPTRFAVGLRELAREFAANGFVRHRAAAELPFARDLWVASFVRSTARAGAATT